MRKKCKVCGAPLNNERCDYCGTDHSKKKKASTQLEDSLNNDNPTNSILITKTQSQQFVTMVNESKMIIPAIIVGIISLFILTGGLWLFFIRSNFTITQLGNSSINFPAYLDSAETVANIPAGSVNDSALLGYWGNGAGSIFLWVFGLSDSVEFLENGTVIITQDETSTTVEWYLKEPGTFAADGREFTYSIDGDVLTITDSANDSWSWQRRNITAVNNNGGDNSNNDSVTVEISDIDIIGSWVWVRNSEFVYTFNDDNTGSRGGAGIPLEEFEWSIVDGNLYLEFDSIAMFNINSERWSVTITNDVLTLVSLQGGGTFSYIRQ